jgi:hypothetical protein
VVEGRSRIYSLRDKKGQPHVTIEVKPASQRIAPRHEEILAEMKASGVDTGSLSESAYDAAYEQALQRVKQSRPPEIVQIKGKGNKAPKEDYLPAVQDFIRSGNWSSVGDLQNTGLYKVNEDFLGDLSLFRPSRSDLEHLSRSDREEALMKAIEAGSLPKSGYVTRDEWEEALKVHGREPTPGPTMEFLEQMANPKGLAHGGAVQGYQAGGVVKAAKKTARSLGDLVDEYVRKVRKFDELGEPTYNVKKAEAPSTAEVPGWHITQDLASILKAGAMDNRLAGSNMQGYDPAHLGGAYFYSDPRLALAQHQRLMDMVGSDPAYAAELPILRAQLRRGNRLVPDEDVGLNVPWQQSYQEGSFATKRPVLINQIDRIYSADPGVTKDMIRDSVIRQRRPGYAEGGQVSGANFPTDDFDLDRIDSIVAELHAMNAA